jgi:thiol-disulfide isomerase/thioredoxin
MKNIFFLLFCVFTATFSFAQNNKRKIYIDVVFPNTLTDTVSLEYQHDGWALTALDKIILKDSTFRNHFEINPQKDDNIIYLNLVKNNRYFLINYLAEPGDSIQIYFDTDKIMFRGNGAEKYQCKYDIDKIMASFPYPEIRRKYNTKNGNIIVDSLYYLNFVTDAPLSINYNYSSAKCGEEVLKWYRPKLSDKIYYLLLANLRGKAENKIWSDFTIMYNGFRANADLNQKTNIKDSLSSIYSNRASFDFSEIPDSLLAFSREYLEYLSSYYLRKNEGFSEGLAKLRGTYSLTDADSEIIEKFNGILRDRIITQYMLIGFTQIPKLSKHIDRALEIVKNTNCRNLLKSLHNSNTEGSTAYNFAIPDINGVTRTQKEFKGKLLLIDFWFTGCSGCRIMAENLKPVAEYFKNNKNIVFLSISADKDINIWKQSVSKELYTTKQSIDLFTEGKGNDHPMIKNYKIRAYPSLILIGKNGKIVTTSVIRPYNERDRNILIQFIEKHI